MAQPTLPQTSDSTFSSEVLKSDRPTLVGFWATWSGPCDMMAASVGDMSQQFGDLVKVRTLNVDENPMTAASYNIESLPTLALFKNGTVVRVVSGAVPRTVVQQLFEEAIAPGD